MSRVPIDREYSGLLAWTVAIFILGFMIGFGLGAVAYASHSPLPERPCGHATALHLHSAPDFKRAAEHAWDERRWRERDPRTQRTKSHLRHRRECSKADGDRLDRIVRAERLEFQRHRARKLFIASITPPGPAVLRSIRMCESGGNYGAVSPDGTYRGAYQFDFQTWRSVGGSGDPAAAPKREQDFRAAKLYRARGSAPWPVCG